MATLYNRARMSTATVGTGTITLGSAVSDAFFTFAEAGVQNGDVVSYVIEDGNDVEVGIGTYTSSGTTLSRDTVTISKIGGTSGTSKINLSGAATVFITARAEDLITLDANNDASTIRNLTQTGYHDLTEISEPASPSANVARIYAKDVNSITNVFYKDSVGRERILGDQWIDVRDFGAVGDGSTDDYAAIQAAIDAVDGGTVFFPWTADGYLISDGLTFGQSGQAKRLVGQNYVKLICDEFDTSTDGVTMYFNTAYQLQRPSAEFIGLTIDMGNEDASDATYSFGRDGLRIDGGDWPYVDCSILNAGRDGLHIEGTQAGRWCENLNGKINIHNCGRDGINFTCPDFDAIFITECCFHIAEVRRWKRNAIHGTINTDAGTYNATISSISFLHLNLDARRETADLDANDFIFLAGDASAYQGGLYNGWYFYGGLWENLVAAQTGFGINTDSNATLNNIVVGPCPLFNLEAFSGASDAETILNRDNVSGTYWIRQAGNEISSAQKQLDSNDDGAGAGPTLILNRNSASPAASDVMGEIIFRGQDDSGDPADYIRMEARIIDASDGSEDGELVFGASVAGSNTNNFRVGNGTLCGLPSGGYKGAGTLNAVGVYDDNTLLTDYVFDKYFDKEVDYPQAVQRAADALDPAMFDIENYIEHFERNHQLYGMPNLDDTIEGRVKEFSLGAMIQKLWQTVELQAIHISQLHARLEDVEDQAGKQ